MISQSYKPIEIILVNDACEDKLQFEKFIPTDIKILKHDVIVNSGPAAARNIGLQKSKGNYIAFLDSDDYWGTDKLKNQVESIQENGCGDNLIIVSPVTIVRNGKVLGHRFPILGDDKRSRLRLFKGPFLSLGSTALFNKNLIKRVGYQNPKLRIYEDYEWQIRMVCEFDIQFIQSSRADVYIEKSKRTHKKGHLKSNHQELISCIKKHQNFKSHLMRYITAGYFLDLAVSDLNQKSYFSMIFNLIISFLIVPRVSIHISRFWMRRNPT